MENVLRRTVVVIHIYSEICGSVKIHCNDRTHHVAGANNVELLIRVLVPFLFH